MSAARRDRAIAIAASRITMLFRHDGVRVRTIHNGRA